ncbi:reverse transcriptase domain-containing protein [Tanacetum coccineum]
MTDRSDGMMTGVFISGLRPGRLFKDLIARPPLSLEDLYTQANNFIRAEEANNGNWLREVKRGALDNISNLTYKDFLKNSRDKYVPQTGTRHVKRSNHQRGIFTPLIKMPAEIYATSEGRAIFRPPTKMYTPPHQRDKTSHLTKGAKAQNNIQTSSPPGTTDRGKNHVEEWPRKLNVKAKSGHEILMRSMRRSSSLITKKNHEQQTHEIEFSSHDPIPAHCNGDDPLVIKADIGGQSLWSLGVITLPLTMYDYPGRGSKTIAVKFMVVQAQSPYNTILGRPGMKKLGAIASTLHALIKFPIQSGTATVRGDILPDQQVIIGVELPTQLKDQLQHMLRDNKDIFAWSPADMTGIPRNLAEHKLNIHPRTFLVKQKKRQFLGHMITSEGIEANPEKVKAIIDMVSLQTITEVQSLNGKLAALGRFLARSAESKALQGPKVNYPTLKKLALTLVHTARRLRRYFQAYTICVLTDQPIRQVLLKLENSGRLAKWDIELDVTSLIPQWPADLTSHTWTFGAGFILIDPHGNEVTYALRFDFPTSNNEVEYEALIAGLELVTRLEVSHLKVFSDSLLLTNHVKGTYEAREDLMKRYLAKTQRLLENFKSFSR